MKKLFTILLVVAMMLSLAGTALAADLFSDIADQSAAGKTAISKLNALDIIDGYPDGTFKPGNDITRAEFAKIACIAAGLKDSGEVLKNTPSKFADVKAGNWYTGWVNLASAQGYVKGFPDGTFKPNNKITNAEVVTVLLRVVGYDDNLPGPWPVDYIAKAGTLGITDDVNFDASANAVRGDVSVMTASTLDQDIVYWDTDKARFLDVTQGSPKTLMAENFKGAVYEGYVGSGWGMNTDADQFTVSVSAGDDVTTSAVETAWSGTFTLAKGCVISSGLVTGLSGHQFDIIYDSKDKEVKFIDVKSTAKNSDDVVADGTKIKVDGVKYSKVPGVTVPASADSYWKVYFNEDGEIYRIDDKSGAALGGLVEKFNTTTEKIEYHQTGNLGANASVDYTDKTVIVEKGGKLVSLSDIKEFDYVTVSTSIPNVDYYLSVKPMATGQVVAEYSGPKIKIGDKKYAYHANGSMSKDAADSFTSGFNFADTYGKTVSYVLTGSNILAYVVADVDATDSSTIYGIVTKVVSDDYEKAVTRIKVLNAKGETVTYDVDTDEVIIQNGAGTYTGSETVDLTLTGKDFIKFRIAADGSIDKIYTAWSKTDADGIAKATEIDKDNSRIYLDNGVTAGWYYVNSDTIIFNTAYADPAVDTADALLDSSANIAANAKVVLDGNTVTYMAINTALSADNKFAIVDALYSTDKSYVELQGIGKYEQSAAFTCATDDIVKYTISGAKATQVTIAFDASQASVAADAYGFKTFDTYLTTKGTVIQPGNVDSVKTSSIKIDGVWYVVDADTLIFDYSDEDAPVVSKLSDVTQGMTAQAYTSNDTSKVGRNSILWFLIVK